MMMPRLRVFLAEGTKLANKQKWIPINHEFTSKETFVPFRILFTELIKSMTRAQRASV